MIITDTHIGKKWKANVPLGRTGDREEFQKKSFYCAIQDSAYEDIYHLGDLFDSWNVSNEDVMFVAQQLMMWAEISPGNEAFFIAGNHDVSRSGKTSSWHLLKEICSKYKNLLFFDQPEEYKGNLFLPFSYTKSYEEMAKEHTNSYDKVFCHADYPDVAALNSINANEIYSGHLHNFRPNNVFGKLEFVKALVPLNHYEAVGIAGAPYRTYASVAEWNGHRDDNHDFCVKIIVQPNETAPNREDIDAMQVIIARAEEEDSKMFEDVELGEFDSRKVFEECMKDVHEELKEEIWGLYKND